MNPPLAKNLVVPQFEFGFRGWKAVLGQRRAENQVSPGSGPSDPRPGRRRFDPSATFTISSTWRTVNPSFKRRNGPGQPIPTRLRTHPHMSRYLRICVPIECSKANSDMVRIVRHQGKYGRPATGTETPPSTSRRLIFGYQIF